MYRYKTRGVCSSQIDFDIEDGKLSYVRFIGGCAGNTAGVAALCIGRTPAEVIDLLEGIPCRGGTSCPDQLSKALRQYLDNEK